MMDSNLNSAGFGLGIAAFFIILIGFIFVVGWKIYVKANQPGWAWIVPIYNYIVLLEISRRPLWWILPLMIPLVNLIIMLIICLDVSKAFGKGAGFGVGLFFLPFIFGPILAFGDAKYLLTEPQEVG
jgi:hypothetical protein